MRATEKNKVYEYVLNSENGATASQIAQALDMELRAVNGLLAKLRRDGKLLKTRGALRADANIWIPNGRYYPIGHNRRY